MGGNVGIRIKESIKSCDSFPQTFALTYNKHSHYKTILGGICSIIVFIIMALLFIVLTIRLASKSDISVNYSQTPFSNGKTDKEEHDLRANDKQIGFVLDGIDKDVNHRRVFDVYIRTNDRFINETTGESQTRITEFFTEKWSNDTFHEHTFNEHEIAHSYWIK